MKKLTTLIFLLFISLSNFAQQAVIECLEVSDSNGAVTIYFSGPQNATKFKIYRASHIFGDYFWINDVLSGSGFYVDNTINAASQTYAYKVEAIIGGHGTGLSDGMRTIFLSLSDLENGLVELNWNSPFISPPEEYEIYYKEGDGEYQLKGLTSNTTYTDTLISPCSGNEDFYQIRIPTGNCKSKSNLKGGVFQDITAPANIIPENATIDPVTGDIILRWLPPPPEDTDIAKYQIWIMNDDGGTTTLPEAEIIGVENLSISLPNDDVCDTTITFCITAQDSCGNSSNYSDKELYVKTINLHDADYDICADKCIISWDSIFWYNEIVEGIRVFRNENDGIFEVIADLAGNATRLTTYGFERGVKYEFLLEAYGQNEKTSTSCIKKVIGQKPELPTHTWLRYASDVHGEIELKWQINSGVLIPKYAIQRSEDGITYETIDTVHLNIGQVQRDSIFTYTDKSSEFYKQPQYYLVTPFDSCLSLGEASNIAKTIHSSVIDDSEGKALIEWTAYETMNPVDHYDIYRIIDSLIYRFPISTVYPGEELSYVDDYGTSIPSSSKVGYHIEAIGKVNEAIPVMDTARSNRNYLTKESHIFMPTGFRPNGGVTQIYKPISIGIKRQNYHFRILNRWGQVVYETYQTVLGWDGTYLGDYVPQGMYVYIVEYETIYNKLKRQRGTFMVLP